MKKIVQAVTFSPGPRRGSEYLKLAAKGWLMGMADLIPGVSGGTIAFITGIYEQLLDAIGSLNKKSLSLILRGQISEGLSLIHVRFLAVLLGAILFAIFSFARVMHYLMTEHTVLTWSLFFGLISASIIVVFKELDRFRGLGEVTSILAGALFAYILVSLIPVDTPEATWFIFLCGFISISAMILPGLSGSFLLLILGKYEFITGAVKSPFSDGHIMILLTFVAGAVSGAAGFSRILNWFLKHYRSLTMAFLTGVLIGSIKKVWPWKEVLETQMIGGKERIIREANVLPELSGELTVAIFLMVLGFGGVLLIDNVSRRRKTNLRG